MPQIVLPVLFPEAFHITIELEQLSFKLPQHTPTFSLREHFGMNGWFSLCDPLTRWCHCDCQEVTDIGFKCQAKARSSQTDTSDSPCA